MAELGDVEMVEEALEVAVESLAKIKAGYAAIGAACGIAIGSFVTYRIVYKKANTKYSELAEQEIDEMRELFSNREVERDEGVVVPEPEKPDIEELQALVRKYNGIEPEKTVLREDQLEKMDAVTNAFQEHEDDGDEDHWDYEAEVANRDPEKPYVIHVDELNETDFTNTKLVYFAGDDVLVDEREQIIRDADVIVGIENLEKFGHGSNEPNTVYIRNEVLEVEAEIVRTENEYGEVVHGFIQHADEISHRRRTRGFHNDE